jgi:hypothetical protein
MATELGAEGGRKHAPAPPIASLLLRLAAGAGALLLIARLLGFAWIDVRCARAALAYPFTLDYGEGIVWQQALLIPGPRMYGPIDHLPFIVFHYPPVYHLASRAVMALGVDPLSAGRMMSLAATAIIVMSIAWLVATELAGRVGRSAVLVGALTGALLPLSLGAVAVWFDLMRVDMLAIALAFLGVVFAVRAEQQPGWLAPAMLAFVLSVYTKQTEIAAPVSALAVLFMARPRAAILSALGGATLGLAALAWLEWLTAGGFIRHIVFYNVNTWSFALIATRLGTEMIYWPLLAAAIVGLSVSWLDRGASARPFGSPGAAENKVLLPIISVWLLLSNGVAVATVGHTGSNVNYFIEPICVCAVAVGLLVGLSWQAVIGFPGRLRLGLVCVACALVVVPVMAKRRPGCEDHFDPAQTKIQENLVQEIAGQDRPVLSEDMVLTMRAGREVPIEPEIFHELAVTGQWDQRRLFDLIDARAFAFLVTIPDEISIPQRYTPEMLAAIARAYPRVQARGPFVVHYPEGP